MYSVSTSNELMSSFDALRAQNTSMCNEIIINKKDFRRTLGNMELNKLHVTWYA